MFRFLRFHSEKIDIIIINNLKIIYLLIHY